MAARTDNVSGLVVLPDRKNDAKAEKNWEGTSKGIVFKKRVFHLSKRAKFIAVLLGFALTGCLIAGLYFTGVFSKAPVLADSLEGEADFQTDDGKEIYNIKVDFSRQIIQLKFVTEIHSNAGRRTRRGTQEDKPSLNFTKVVFHDYKNKKKYLIVPGENKTTKCLRMKLQGEMIPKDLLKHAKNEAIPNEVKEGVIQRLRFADQSEADVLVPSVNETQKLIYRGNGWNISVHSRQESELNLTDVTNFKCFEYEEETNKIEDDFYRSDQSKFLLENVKELHQRKLEAAFASFNVSNITIGNNSVHSRNRRGIMDKLSKWSHGNWCGAYTGGYENHCRTGKGVCKAPYETIREACKQCNPVVDAVDAQCMEHDRCLLENGPGPSGCLPQGNRCSCDYKLVTGAAIGGIKCAADGNSECFKAAASITLLFTSFLSCWFPNEICFPSVQVECGCSLCSCPRMKTFRTCVPFKFCVPLGSGKVSW